MQSKITFYCRNSRKELKCWGSWSCSSCRSKYPLELLKRIGMEQAAHPKQVSSEEFSSLIGAWTTKIACPHCSPTGIILSMTMEIAGVSLIVTTGRPTSPSPFLLNPWNLPREYCNSVCDCLSSRETQVSSCQQVDCLGYLYPHYLLGLAYANILRTAGIWNTSRTPVSVWWGRLNGVRVWRWWL